MLSLSAVCGCAKGAGVTGLCFKIRSGRLLGVPSIRRADILFLGEGRAYAAAQVKRESEHDDLHRAGLVAEWRATHHAGGPKQYGEGAKRAEPVEAAQEEEEEEQEEQEEQDVKQHARQPTRRRKETPVAKMTRGA